MAHDSMTLSRPPGARVDWTIDQDWSAYTQAEHDVWITLYERQRALLPGRACDPFLRVWMLWICIGPGSLNSAASTRS